MALLRRTRGNELFPGFTDVQEIGIGSLAVVFRAREIGTNRMVALKLLNVRDASPRSLESFERESIALGALSSHPNIVTLYRTFRTPDGRPVLVLELCAGAVADRLHGGAGLPVTDAVAIGIKIAGALETAHRGGILHRDVKPQNILVTEFGEPALADFGVAMLQSSTQTTAGLFDFTTLHAAPELLEGGGTSAATDVYELASSLYQLIAGQSAFRAYDGESPASVILRILRDPVRPLSLAQVPVELSDLLIRAMSKEKDERPPTAVEFAAELADVEIAQGWHRTQFLIRDPGPLVIGNAPAITRMPDAVPRGLPSTFAPSGPISTGPAVPVRPQLEPVPVDEPVPVVPVEAVPVEPLAVEPVPFEPLLLEPVPPDPVPVDEPVTAALPVPVAEPVAAPPPSVEPRVERAVPTTDGWSSPTIVPAAAWTAPPAAPRADLAPAVPEPPARRAWWSAPPGADQSGAAQSGAEQSGAAQPVPAEAPVEAPPVGSAVEQAAGVAPRPRRVPVDIDDDYFPARRPIGTPEPPAPALPDVPRAGRTASGEFPRSPQGADASAVPVWAVRTPTQMQPAVPAGPQFSSDLSLDAMSLRRKATIRAGVSSVLVDEQKLRLRTWFRRTTIPWSDVRGFEAHVDTVDGGPTGAGHIVVLTGSGPVELPGTRRPASELRYVHALLDAYCIRAQRLANR